MTPPSVFYQPARSASERLTKLMGQEVFDFPKDEQVLQKFIEMATSPSDEACIVLDFFAGSGTTAHAVLLQNAIDGGRRKFFLVQLPEPLSPDSTEQEEAATYCDKLGRPRRITELTKQRLRLAGDKVRQDFVGTQCDTGFRVFGLDASNIRAWNPNPAALEQSLFAHQDHLVEKRTESDVLYELLIKLGLDLCVPIAHRIVAGKGVHSVGGGVLMACLATHVEASEVEVVAQGLVAWYQELAPAGDTTCVFRDSAFADDVAKTNMAAILAQNGIANVRSL